MAAVLFALAAAPAGAESFASWSSKAEKQRDPVAAIEAYTNALRLWKKSDGKKAKAKTLAARAKLYADAGSNDAALRDLSSAIKLDDKTAAYFFRRGRLRYDLGRDSEAISDFYKATHLNLEYRDAYLYRGLAYQRQGDAAFAREDFKTACRLGLKEACAKTPKAAKSARSASGADGFEAAEDSAPPPKKKRSYKLNWQACLDGLTACTDAGNAFGDCVGKAPICEDEPKAGCCPESCVTNFRRLAGSAPPAAQEGAQENEVSGGSEAEAFRQVFTPESTCMKKGAIKPR